MSIDTEHLDKKMENLSLTEQQLRHNISLDTCGNKLSTSGEYKNIDSQFSQKPKRSLLSSSLAGEKHYYTTDTNLEEILIGDNIDEKLEKDLDLEEAEGFYSSMENTNNNFVDEHPEPELLASSVGKEIGGRLVPSSSTISLLSLNAYMNNDLETSPKTATGNIVSPKVIQTGFPINNQQFFNQQLAYKDRKGSLTNIRSRNSLTHLSQKRLQTYHTLSTPSPIQSDLSYLPHSTTQSIPIDPKMNINIPDSPSLNPTSLGGSPSRFWLSSQTPPASIASSLTKNSRTHLLQPQQPTQTTQPLYIPIDNNYTTSMRKNGNTSPLLIPVQTPVGDTPMTPLF